MKKTKQNIFLLVGALAGLALSKLMHIDFFQNFTADWVSAIADLITVPLSVMILVWQLHQSTIDRRYDARTVFSISWVKKIENKIAWIKEETYSSRDDGITNCETDCSNAIPVISNVGGKIAQEVLVCLKTARGEEYFSKAVVDKNYQFIILTDLFISENPSKDIYEIHIFYLSELGQRIHFKYDVRTKKMSNTVTKKWDGLKDEYSNTNVRAIQFRETDKK